ncbi:MAG: hypothetical protein FJY92_00535, partial [Candidatus Hydrogenedentes bacterium]|nr:hypothetical protein [Candidatus Hydrogenedentota bacterium]
MVVGRKSADNESQLESRNIRRMPVKQFRRLFATAVLGTMLCVSALANEIAELLKGAPEVPPGYAEYKEVQAALISGKVKLIKPPAEMPASITVTKDVEYGKGGEKSLLLDLYAPKEIAKPVPLLIFIHGGGWQMGDKKD